VAPPCSTTSSSAWRSGRTVARGARARPAAAAALRAFRLRILHPNALSGGMRQRAALLRTLLFDTDVILLDEPFGALDAQTKLRMQEWLLGLWSDFGKTVVFVTHDIEEAIYYPTRFHVMATRPGRIVESIPISIPRPRQRSATLLPDFIAIKERCLELLTAAHNSSLDERPDMR